MGKISLYIYVRNDKISLINLKKIKFFGKKRGVAKFDTLFTLK
nr:MAG: hypothetical protein [Bacteriophage sp.]UVX37580.1 MAG: hypothetical protein [Bacteriophage sp.]